MALRAVFADVLADLKIPEALDNKGSDDQRDQQRGQRREGCSERQIAEDSERSE